MLSLHSPPANRTPLRVDRGEPGGPAPLFRPRQSALRGR